MLGCDERTSSRAGVVVVWLSIGLMAGALLIFSLAPWPFLDKLRAIGFAICPQRPAHSVFIAGTPLPLEARKVGIYLGFLSTMGYLLLLRRGRANQLPPRHIVATLMGCVALMGIDGFNALLHDTMLPHLYSPNNDLRLATGLLGGMALAVLTLPVLNVSLWREGKAEPLLTGWRQMTPAVTLQAALFGTVASGAPFTLYPLATLCIVGVVGALVFTNTLLLVGVIHWPRPVAGIWGLVPVVAVAWLLSSLELGGMAAFRLALVGTAPL